MHSVPRRLIAARRQCQWRNRRRKYVESGIRTDAPEDEVATQVDHCIVQIRKR